MIRATDFLPENQLPPSLNRHVVLKLMKYKDQFDREREQRKVRCYAHEVNRLWINQTELNTLNSVDISDSMTFGAPLSRYSTPHS